MASKADRTSMALPDTRTTSRLPGSDVWPGGSSSLLEAIVHSSEDAIITKDLEGVITSWNPAAERIFGYLPEEMIGQSVLRLIPEALKHQEPEILRQLRAGEQIKHFETVRVRKDGRKILVSLTISPVRDAEGRVIGVSKIVRDVTEQKQADLARFRLAAIVDSAEDGIVSKDLNGVVTSWNRAAEQIFGYSEAEMVGTPILRLMPPELQAEEAVILSKIRAGERVEHYESERVTKTGERISVSLTISPLRDGSGAIVGASKIVRDITRHKAMEERVAQTEKLAASGKMAATIAHEINNPLEAVLNLVYLGKVNTHEPEVVEYLSMAEAELERLAHIAKQTLGFHREQGAASAVSLSGLVRDALRIYDSKLRSAEIELRTHLSATQEIVIRRGEIMQVISNLITNAVHAMSTGGVLEVSVEKALRDGAAGLRLTVRDNGVGIPGDNLNRIFEPFFTTRTSIGTGIGLWIARQFVHGHGGVIEVESSTEAQGHGTAFTVWLPVQSPYAREVAA